MRLHTLLKTKNLLHGAGQGTADIDHIQDLQRSGLQRHKILMIAAQCGGAHIVTAHIEDDAVPIQHESGGHLGRERKRLNAGTGKIGGNQTDFLLLDHFAALGQTEVGVHHIEVKQLRPSGLRRLERKV